LDATQPVAMHSSLSSLGMVAGGATTVLEALLRALGPGGTLMAPTYTYSFSSVGDWPAFIHGRTPSMVGAISEAVRRHPQAIRSFHPTHSVAAIGPRAAELTGAHLAGSPLGVGSPFHRLAQWGGEVMLLGCDHRSNSIVHVAEVLAGLSYIDVPFSPGQNYETAEILQGDKRVVEVKLYEVPGCSRGFQSVEPVLRRAGVIRDAKVAQAEVQLFSARRLLDVLTPVLRDEPALLLCEQEECSICPLRRRALEDE
jgi:aminoglycoside 3-N-acetyltransferase